MLRTCLLALIFALAGAPLAAQSSQKPSGKLSRDNLKKLRAAEDSLATLAQTVLTDSVAEARISASNALEATLFRALQVENSFKYKFGELASLSILYPPDSSFRVFTWQLFVNDSTYRYHGAIQLDRRVLVFFPLQDRSDEMTLMPRTEVLSASNWYGALYYNLREFDSGTGKKYLLFGFDGFEFFEKRKLIEVLSFDPKTGEPIFGAKVFDRQKEPGKRPAPPEARIMLEYSAEAAVRCNWDEEYQLVLFDHLETTGSPFGRGLTHIPDGSVEGFHLENGRWKHISKVFNDVMAEPPRPAPVLDERQGKGIMGKPKRKSGW